MDTQTIEDRACHPNDCDRCKTWKRQIICFFRALSPLEAEAFGETEDQLLMSIPSCRESKHIAEQMLRELELVLAARPWFELVAPSLDSYERYRKLSYIKCHLEPKPNRLADIRYAMGL